MSSKINDSIEVILMCLLQRGIIEMHIAQSLTSKLFCFRFLSKYAFHQNYLKETSFPLRSSSPKVYKSQIISFLEIKNARIKYAWKFHLSLFEKEKTRDKPTYLLYFTFTLSHSNKSNTRQK